MPGQNGQWVHDAAERYGRPLTLYTARIVGSEQARDIVQEAFARLCAQDEGKIGSKLPQWLYAVCRNRALDLRRKEKRMTLLDDNCSDAMSGRAPDPASVAQDRDDSTSILRLLDELPPNQQEVIRLKFQHGLSYRRISEVTRLSVSNVGFLMHAGLKTIRRRMNVNENANEV